MIEMLKRLLELREILCNLGREAETCCGGRQAVPEIEQMAKLERKLFRKINRWTEPDPMR
jgi:hypothetical protein